MVEGSTIFPPTPFTTDILNTRHLDQLPNFQHTTVLITPKRLDPDVIPQNLLSYPKIYFPTCHLWLPDPRQARMTISVTETARTCSPATSKCQQVGYDCWSFTGSSSVSVRSGLEVQRKCILTQWVHRDMYTHAHLQICAHARPSVMEVLMNCCFSLSSYWGEKRAVKQWPDLQTNKVTHCHPHLAPPTASALRHQL